MLRYCYGMTVSDTSVILGVSAPSIKRWLISFEKNGTVDPKMKYSQERWPHDVYDFIKRFIEDDPVFLIEELRDVLMERFPLIRNFSTSTICRALRQDLNLSRKVMAKRAREASKKEVKDYIFRLSFWYRYPEQLVFVDETSKDGRSALRKFGWTQIGKPAIATLPFSRGKRVSALAAYDSTGFVGWDFVEGTFTRKRFHESFKQKILPFLNPYPFPRSIVILDNARIHCYNELIDLIESVGAICVFLPPYCPMLSPIELAFGLVKKWIQRHANRVWNTDPEGVMDIAFREACSNLNNFNHCGYFDGFIDDNLMLNSAVDEDD